MNQHSPHADLPTLSSTSPITNTRTQQQPPPSQTNNITTTHPRRRRILHPDSPQPHTEPTPTELRDAAVRTAKLSIRSKLREDWEWDPAASLLHRLQDCDPSSNTTNPHSRPNGAHNSPNDDDDNTVSDSDSDSDPTTPPTTWREREPDSSDASSTSTTTTTDPPPPSHQHPTPDSLTTHLLARKRARRLALDDEMRWNDGLRTYVLRRDDWTGGRVKLVRHTLPAAPVTLRQPPSLSSPTSPATATAPFHATVAPTAPTSVAVAAPTTLAIKTELVPLAPPLLPPTHPIRAAITPLMYPSIYSKVVVQGLAPTVPVNLRDVTGALVRGWKEDGLWPPKSTVAEVGPGVGGAGRRNGGGGGRNGERGKAEKGERERGLAKGVGAVKRALGLGLGGGVGGSVEGGVGR